MCLLSTTPKCALRSYLSSVMCKKDRGRGGGREISTQPFAGGARRPNFQMLDKTWLLAKNSNKINALVSYKRPYIRSETAQIEPNSLRLPITYYGPKRTFPTTNDYKKFRRNRARCGSLSVFVCALRKTNVCGCDDSNRFHEGFPFVTPRAGNDGELAVVNVLVLDGSPETGINSTG